MTEAEDSSFRDSDQTYQVLMSLMGDRFENDNIASKEIHRERVDPDGEPAPNGSNGSARPYRPPPQMRFWGSFCRMPALPPIMECDSVGSGSEPSDSSCGSSSFSCGSGVLWDRMDASRSGSSLSTESGIIEMRRVLRRKSYVRRCAKAMLGFWALGALSISVAFIGGDEDREMMFDFLPNGDGLGNYFYRKLSRAKRNDVEEATPIVPEARIEGDFYDDKDYDKDYDNEISPQEEGKWRERYEHIRVREQRERENRQAQKQKGHLVTGNDFYDNGISQQERMQRERELRLQAQEQRAREQRRDRTRRERELRIREQEKRTRGQRGARAQRKPLDAPPGGTASAQEGGQTQQGHDNILVGHQDYTTVRQDHNREEEGRQDPYYVHQDHRIDERWNNLTEVYKQENHEHLLVNKDDGAFIQDD